VGSYDPHGYDELDRLARTTSYTLLAPMSKAVIFIEKPESCRLVSVNEVKKLLWRISREALPATWARAHSYVFRSTVRQRPHSDHTGHFCVTYRLLLS
jgi:hypothetical protein